MEDENAHYPVRKPGRLLVYPFWEIQNFDEENNEQTDDGEGIVW